MTTDKRAKVLAQVRTMLEIARGTSFEAEAQTAFAKAQELMAKYNLTELEVGQAAADAGLKASVTKEKVDSFTKGTMWKAQAARVIAKNFRCMAYQSWHGPDETLIMFLGQEGDVEIATEVYKVAVLTIEKLAKKFRAERRDELRNDGRYQGKAGSRAACLSWIEGFIAGMGERFDQMREELTRQNNRYALVLVLPPEVEAEARRMNLIYTPPTPEQVEKWRKEQEGKPQPKVRPYKARKPKASEMFDPDAYERGLEKGKQFDHKKEG